MKKLISSVMSFIMLVTVSTPALAKPSDVPYGERPLTVDTDGINTAIDTLYSDLKKPDNRDKVFEDYRMLLEKASQNGDVRQVNMIELEKLNYDIPSKYSREFINDNIDNAVKYGNSIKMAVKSILDSCYSEDFKEYWGEERTAHVEKMYDNTEQVSVSKAFYDRYFELTDKNADGTEFAGLLKEIIAYNNEKGEENGFDNFIDYIYASDNTGFTASDIESYIENTVGDYYYYVNKFKNYGVHHGLDAIDEDTEVKDPLSALSYTKMLDEKIGRAYSYLIKNGLAFIGASEKRRGVTAPMRFYGDAGIIVSGSDRMRTLIHEFGHYQSFLNTETDSEALFFGEHYSADFQELNSQAFEFISTDYYEDIYGNSAQGMKFRTIVSLMQQLAEITVPAMTEIMLYQADLTQMSNAELDKNLSGNFGSEWYIYCQQFFTSSCNYINYSLMLFNAIQIYGTYIHDKTAGINKYLEACSYKNGSYGSLTEKLGLTGAFDENAGDYLRKITEDIFKTEYDMEYTAVLDYFENGTYLGKVFPTVQRVSVNGGEAQTLYAYNSNGFNYIRIRDLAKLLSGTKQQFDVEYSTENYTVNIITDTPYISDGTEMTEIDEVRTAGQKSNGTFCLMRDGEPVLSGGAMFINGWNCYLLRGLTEKGIFDFKIDYDEKNNTVLIFTE